MAGNSLTTASKPTIVAKKWIYILLGATLVGLIIAGVIGYFVGLGKTRPGRNVVAGPSTSKPTIAPSPTPPASAYYLPKSLKPLHYDLDLKVYLPDPNVPSGDTFRFDGNYGVNFICQTATNQVVMHAIIKNNMNITAASIFLSALNGSDTGNSISQSFSVNSQLQFVTFKLSKNCQPGSLYRLSFQYRSRLNPGLTGFYRSSYVENGTMRWLGLTQFAPLDARRAFPCWDEPAWKATYNVSLTAPSQYVALSNGKQFKAMNFGSGWTKHWYKQTPAMSSYLVAFVVADFSYVERFTADGSVRFRIWGRRELNPYLQYAASVGAQVLALYSSLFQIPFPLSKQDMVAVPDFSFGAMENWGLVTYRESAIVYQEGANFPVAVKEDVAKTIAHELAHQWFGDLVTMAWWNDVFLNEGFAEFIEYIGEDQVPLSHGTFQELMLFEDTNQLTAMHVDELLSSRPISTSVKGTTVSINQMWDTITYKKGASTLRMLNFTLGKPLFIQALSNYLNLYKYSNANHHQLYASLTKTVNGAVKDWNWNPLNVSTLMNPWVEQMGYPMVTMNRTGRSLKLSQSRFILDGSGRAPTPSKYGYQWYIPIWFQAGSYVSPLIWMEPHKPRTISLPGSVSASTPVVLNYQSRSFYRAGYDSNSWALIQRTLTSPAYQSIDVRSRAQILDDALTMAKGGMIPYQLAISIMSYLRQESNYVPWRAIVTSLSFFNNMFSLDTNFAVYRNYILSIIQPAYWAVGWDDSGPNSHVFNHLKRQLVLSLACSLQLPDCTSQALRLWAAFKTNCEYSKVGSFKCAGISGNLRRIVYCRGIAQGSTGDWNFLWGLFLREQVSAERDNLMYGLACTPQPWLIGRLLNEALSAQNIRPQDVRYTFEYIGTNPVGKALLWNFLTSNWESLRISYAADSGFGIKRIVNAATSAFNSAYQIKQLSAFMAANPLGSGEITFKQALSSAYTNYQWRQTYYAAVISAMKSNTLLMNSTMLW